MDNYNELIESLRSMEPMVCSTAADAIEALQSRVAELESRLEVTENAPDGIACRDMTIEMLEKRIKELEDERAEREKQRPVAWLDKSTEKRPGDTVWLPDDLKGMDTSWLVPLYAASTVTSDIVNKAFADGKAEGHGDATAEASVVIGELRARVAELEAERRTPRVRIEWKIEGDSGHGEWFPSRYRTALADYCKVMDYKYGTSSHRVVDEPEKQLLTPEQIEKADEAIREALSLAYDCMRVWNAWSYGTMGPDDFWPVAESDERVAEIRNATAVALGFKVDNQ